MSGQELSKIFDQDCILDFLDHRQRTVIEHCFGLNGAKKMTLREIGQRARELNLFCKTRVRLSRFSTSSLSAETVRSIRNIALNKIERRLRELNAN